MIDYTDLQKAAEYAAQDTIKFADEGEEMRALQQFHEEVEPQTVLALIAENEQLREAHEQICTSYNKVSYASEERGKQIDQLKAELEHTGYDHDLLRNECDQLRAEVAGLRTGYEAYEQVNAELKAEVEGLRKDSDKWKIVQRSGDQLLADEGRAAIWSACSRILISVASELNSGRSVVTEEGVTSGGVEIGDWRVTVERIDAALGQGEQS